MHFVYAFFFAYKDEVFVKVGQSAVPYKRLQAITHGCPFPLTRAVFSQIGSSTNAKSFEAGVRYALDAYRTRGEWYCFANSDGHTFSAAIHKVFARVTGRRLSWSEIDVDEFNAMQARAAERWLGRRCDKPVASRVQDGLL